MRGAAASVINAMTVSIVKMYSIVISSVSATPFLDGLCVTVSHNKASVLINQINFLNFAPYLKNIKILPHYICLHFQET